MTKKELLNISFEEDNEKKLKQSLIDQSIEYSFNKLTYILSYKNQLLLTYLGIDENSFNQMLFKNYIFFLNNIEKTVEEDKIISKDTKEIINLFNYHIKNNDFESAFKIYSNNFIIYDLLCILYTKNINRSEQDKINAIDENNIDDVYEKLAILKNTNLTFKRTNVKVHQRISSK